VRPHELVFQGFLSDEEMLDEVSFKGKKYDVNEGNIPSFSRLGDHKITNQRYIMVSLGCEDFVPILLVKTSFNDKEYFDGRQIVTRRERLVMIKYSSLKIFNYLMIDQVCGAYH
jgi:hypothetical protein